MINIAFNGNIYYENNSLATDIAYKLYFHKKNNGSSSSVWSDIRHTEIGLNQYNINLGDPDILGNDGVASEGDEVILIYWYPMSLDNSSLSLIQWSGIHYTLTSAQTYVQNVQLMTHKNPFCDFYFDNKGVNESSSIVDINSNDDIEWIFENKTHFQKYKLLNQILFEINKIPNNAVDIIWGDGSTDTGLNLPDSPFNHTYTHSGNYSIQVTLSNSDLLTCDQQINVDIINNVYNGLILPPVVYQNTQYTYIPDISGETSSIIDVDYYIDGDYFNTFDWDESFDYKFLSYGPHTIRQCINYNNGFEIVSQCHDYIVHLTTIAHFIDTIYGCGLKLISDSLIGEPPVIKYQWDVINNNIVLSHVEGIDYQEWYYTFPYVGVFNVRLQVEDQYSISSYEKEYVIDECANDSSGGGGSDSGGAPWIYNEYKEPLPKITIVDINTNDIKNKKILIIEVKEL